MAPSRNGRTAGGQFAKGNAGGPGNPHGKRVAELRAALLEAVTPADIRRVAEVLVKRAKAGEVAAIRELFDRLMGKAQPATDEVRPFEIVITPELQARAEAIIAKRRSQSLEA